MESPLEARSQSTGAAVEQLEAIFIGTSRVVLSAVLEAHNGDVERAVDYLLSGPRGGMVGTGSSQLELDAEMARQLMADDNDFRGPYVRDGARESSSSQSGSNAFNFDSLDGEQLDQIVTNIKEIVVPAMQSSVADVVFPPIESSTDKLNFDLSNVRVSNFRIPLDRTDVQMKGSTIGIDVVNVDIELAVGSWRYERRTRPKIRDSGSARATLNNVNVHIKIIEGPDARRPLEVETCVVDVSRVTLKIAETKASWLYNFLAVVFRPVLKSSAEEFLKKSIVDELHGQASSWGSWVNGGD